MTTNQSNAQNVDLDLFLTAVESKLRGPFSSLDLTKTVITPALRGNDVTAVQYLSQISQVLSKSDKISQMRILIGLLGLDPQSEMDSVIYSILRQAQGKGQKEHGNGEKKSQLTYEEKLAHRYEEWVRIIGGLIQGIMFKEQQDDPNEHQSFGEEAQELLDTTCREIRQQVLDLAQESSQKEQANKQDGERNRALSLLTADFDPTFAPFRYSLLNPDLLAQVIPEAQVDGNPHFVVNQQASILSLDDRLEKEKAREESDHAVQKQTTQRTASSSSDRSAASVAQPMAYMPGMMKKKAAPSTAMAKKGAGVATANRSKPSSLFITRKPPAAATATAVKRTGLHVRKAGASQRLVGKGRQLAAGGGAAARAKTGGRALKASTGAKSKMKMLDASEAADLAKHQDEKGSQKTVSLKRKAMGTKLATSITKVMRTETTDTATEARTQAAASSPAKEDSPPPPPPADSPSPERESVPPQNNNANGTKEQANTAADALAAAALSKYQTQVAATTAKAPPPVQKAQQHTAQHSAALAAAALTKYQQTQQQQQAPPAAAAAAAAKPPAPSAVNWQQLIASKSNRLNDQDRHRVQQFFEQRFNPTPGQSVYKMKLHEDRLTDPNTGKPIKETYYLELNYENFTSKQSKKVKRY